MHIQITLFCLYIDLKAMVERRKGSGISSKGAKSNTSSILDYSHSFQTLQLCRETVFTLLTPTSFSNMHLALRIQNNVL